jgi:acyl transferase domain-containing protein/acyl carrier protein
MSDTAIHLRNLSARKLALLGERLRATPFQCFLSEPVAVIGLACRFPGAASAEEFWRLLCEGREAITEIPPDRWDVDAYYDPDPQAPGKSNSRWGGFLDGVDRFDAAFFGIPPREARHMDPRQRLLLETAWTALDDAGIAPERLSASHTGVFIGHMVGDYYSLETAHVSGIDAHASTGNLDSILANRLSYALNLQGPSLAVDTACSSSLVALYLACQSLRQDECRLALAGGVNLILTPEMHVMGAKSRLLAPDGHCKTFDRSADGFVRGEGCGLIVLKRYADAIADGDRVQAVVRGVAVNQDGRTNGISAPNGLSQQRVIRRALENAQLDASMITFVETHGTGTVVGDSIEFESLAQTYGTPSDFGPCYLGAVKTNVGHLEGAAGVAGVIKMVLSLRHELIPPNRNLRQPNPHLDLESTRFRLPLRPEPWTVTAGPRRGAVSSFGLGGTNGHVILEECAEESAVHPVEPRPTRQFQRQSYWLHPRRDGAVEAFADMLYRLEWQPKALEPRPVPSPSGEWRILAPGGVLGDVLADRLRHDGRRASAARGLSASALGQPQEVVFLDTFGEESEPPPAAEAKCARLLGVIRELIRAGTSPRLWVVTRLSQAVVDGDPVRPAAATLWGLARALRLEHPELNCVCVDLGSGTADLDLLSAESLTPGEPQVAYRNGQRYVARLIRHRADATQASPKIHADATYLITGGLGALGLEVAESLADQGARHLVLAGRSVRDDVPTLKGLRSRGVSVRVVRADVSRRDDVEALVAACRAEGALRGVVHAAGVLDDGTLANQTPERFARVMAAKVRGAWELHVQTRGLPLDFFVGFSSVASLLGAAGQANYAAANAFLDALAHHRRALRLPGLSINWGPWSDAGMASRLHARLQMHGEGLIDPDRGVRLFADVLGQDSAQLGAFRVDWPRFAVRYPAPEFLEHLLDRPTTARLPDTFDPGFLPRLRTAPGDRRGDMLADFVRAQVASVLGQAAGSIPRTRGFAHLGMDSLGAIELRTRLEQALDCRLPTTLAFDYPDVEALTTYLLDAVGLRAGPADESLENLTQDEIAALLAGELGASGSEDRR